MMSDRQKWRLPDSVFFPIARPGETPGMNTAITIPGTQEVGQIQGGCLGDTKAYTPLTGCFFPSTDPQFRKRGCHF